MQVGFGTSDWRQYASEQELQFHDGILVNAGAHALSFGGDYTWFPVLGGQTNNFAYGAFQFFDDPSTILTDTAEYPEGFQTQELLILPSCRTLSKHLVLTSRRMRNGWTATFRMIGK